MVFILLPKLLMQKNRYAFTDAQPGRDILSTPPLPVTETILFFLVKCAICVLLVLVALQWRADLAPAGKKDAVERLESRRKAGGLAEDAVAEVSSLIHAGGAAIAGAARDKCTAAPRECFAAAQRLQAAAGRAH